MTDEPDPCRVVLVRHGAMATTDVVPGHKGCPGLSPVGHQQADALALRLQHTNELGRVGAVYTSMMRRAIETTAPISAALGIPARQDCSFCELHDGDVDGLALGEAAERFWTPRSQSSEHLPWNPNAPNAESVPGLVSRACGGLIRLVYDHPGQTVVVITHGGVINSSFMCFGNDSFRSAWARTPEHASITEWHVHAPQPGRPTLMGVDAELVRFDDTSHLAE